MRVLICCLFATLVMVGKVAKADEAQPYTMEATVTVFHLGSDLNGYAKNRDCDTCKERRFVITPDVKAHLDGKEVPLKHFVLSKHKPTFLVINKETNKLIRMNWFSKK